MEECDSTECNCGWCGRCAKQLEHQRYVENLRGYGIPSWEDEMKEAEDGYRTQEDC